MALQDNSSVLTYSPQQVAAAFVNQYYQTLHNSPEHVHRFYSDSSTLGREDCNGNMTSVTTMHGINSQIMSTDYTGYVIELQTVDTQASYMGGVLVLVTGSFMTPDAVKKKFTQSFFLAPQGNGAYFVLNDMFRFVSEIPSTVMDEVLADHDNESTQKDTLPAESALAHESTVPGCPSTASLPVNDVVTSLSANGDDPVKNDTGVGACVNGVKNVDMPEAVATPAPIEKAAPAPTSAEKAASTTPSGKAAPAPAAEKTAPTTPSGKAAPAPTSAEKAAPAPTSAEKTAPTTPSGKAASAPAPPKEVTKRTYASIVKETMESTLPAPAPTVKPKPSPQPKETQSAEKSATSPPKPAQAINTAPPADKNIPKSKHSDEPGYSIFVKNLPYNATVQMVEQEFRKFGAIKPGGIQVRNRQFDGFCFGFIEFESQHSMQEALKAHTVYFGSIESYIQEKRTTTRFVNGVIKRGDDNGNARFQSGRGGYQGANFRARGEGYGNNGNYHDGDNMRNGYRNQNGSGRGQGPRGNSYYQNKNGYHENGNGYHQNGYAQNVNQQRRPSQNSNGGLSVLMVPPSKYRLLHKRHTVGNS